VAPRREITTVGVAEYSGFITIIGKVLAFNASVGWYNPVPRAMVRVHIDSPYPFAKIITLADEHGGFVVHGIAPTPYVPGNKWFIDAWVLDEETGAIQYAPDLGIYGAKQFAPFVSPLTHPTRSSIVVMKCVPVTLFDIIDPRTERTTMMPDPRLSGYWQGGGGWFYAGGGEVVPQDFVTRGDLLFYGAYYNNWEPLAMVFVPPEARFSILFRLGRPALGRPAMVLVNANEEFPEGQGFKAKGEALVITNTAYRAARDMVLMTNSRYERLKLRNVRSLSADERLAKADDYLAEAKECYGARAYGEAYRKALLAWSWVYRAYSGEVMPLIDDTSTSAFFFFLLIIPSALIIEKLVLHREGRGRLVSILGVGAVLLLIFSYIHPALTVMSISSMALLGATSLILFLLAALILADETERIIKSISLRLLGIHKVERGRVGVAMMSLSTSLENMRKRPFRAFLTLLTIISVAAAFTSLTSVTYYTTVKHVPLQREALYDGIFMKVGYATPPDGPLQMYLVDCAREVVKGKGSVFPRVWYYPPSISNPRIGVEAVISSEGGQASVKAAMGISHEEFALLFEEALSSGRGFIEGEYYACVLPRSIADALEVEVGDRVEVFGLELTVVGIIDTLVLTDVFDLDGFAPAPIDPLFVGSLGFDVVAPAQVAPPSLSLGRAVILPYKLALDLGGYVAAVSIRFPRGIAHEDLVQYSSELVTLLDTAVYVGWGGKVSKASRVSTYLAIGWEIIPVLVVIGAVNVGASILGNVKERGREIFVYSAVGLSPFGATIMYVTESIVYALLGSAIGYFIGFTLNSVLLQLNMLPADFAFNSASVFVIASLAAIVIAALASSSYPASVAAKLITPSLERRWKPPTKPKGDEWTIPLPLKIPSLEETV
ncbi:TPA: ABC transporter permease, partial [Candidatus Bathyarchaeota archaeon]|nr:ABC transporter permease [Candidatus Bathyarchaeota archaeon]